MFAPKRVPHPNIIAFTEKVTNLEPEMSPYFCKCIDHSLSHSVSCTLKILSGTCLFIVET